MTRGPALSRAEQRKRQGSLWSTTTSSVSHEPSNSPFLFSNPDLSKNRKTPTALLSQPSYCINESPRKVAPSVCLSLSPAPGNPSLLSRVDFVADTTPLVSPSASLSLSLYLFYIFLEKLTLASLAPPRTCPLTHFLVFAKARPIDFGAKRWRNLISAYNAPCSLPPFSPPHSSNRSGPNHFRSRESSGRERCESDSSCKPNRLFVPCIQTTLVRQALATLSDNRASQCERREFTRHRRRILFPGLSEHIRKDDTQEADIWGLGRRQTSLILFFLISVFWTIPFLLSPCEEYTDESIDMRLPLLPRGEAGCNTKEGI